MKKNTVTIGIPAYQAELNIKNLLLSILRQKTSNVRIEKIIVYADGCTDQTVKMAKLVKNKRIEIIASKNNKGFAYALQSLINRNNSDIFILLNDDIRIDSNFVIQELANPLVKNNDIGLVGGNIKALLPETFIGRCIYTSYLAFLPLRYSLKKGETHLTCDGKILALSKVFSKTLKLTKLTVGNVDIYLYYENMKQGRLYKFAKKAEVFFRLPETIGDFRSQESRSEISRRLVKERFSSLFAENHHISPTKSLTSLLSIFLRYPLESLIFKFYINTKQNLRKKAHLTWKLALTTKKLSILGFDLDILFIQL